MKLKRRHCQSAACILASTIGPKPYEFQAFVPELWIEDIKEVKPIIQVDLHSIPNRLKDAAKCEKLDQNATFDVYAG